MKKLALNRVILFPDLGESDLFIDAIYEGGTLKNAGDDPISKLLGCGNQGGFRYKGSIQQPGGIQLCVLYSEMSDPDWPDSLDPELGIFVYFGDNKRPGHEIHDTRKKGNEILRKSFDHLHLNERKNIPPFFVFTKGPKGRDVIFRGLAAPGAKGFSQSDDLVAVWKTKMGRRFTNYRAMFTILDVPHISRAWVRDLWEGNPFTQNASVPWVNWVKNGEYSPLVAPRSREYRTKGEQLPTTGVERDVLFSIINFFKNHPNREYAFEKCAAEIVHFMDPNIVEYDVTRPWKDGGRDLLGRYRIGFHETGISVEFSLEAKCKLIQNGSGVKETARLISRLRHRQFGIFVTTSFVSEQAYKEIVEDGHPVVILCGRDIANILIQAGLNNGPLVKDWLETNFS
jgi:hypothetical protein